MKKYLILIILCFTSLSTIVAQDNKVTVTDFYLNETDITANTYGTTVYDQNGDKCALIKIRTNVEGFVYDAGYLGITKTEQKIGEIWVYVPAGVKKLILSHPTLATLDYNFPTGQVQSARTYIMQLDAKEVFEQVIEDNTKKGTVKFDIFPKSAHVTLNGIPLYLDSTGKGEEHLSYGRYSYRITAENYYPLSGRLRINEEQQNQTLNIRLKQNYGWLKIQYPEGLDESTIYIDGMKAESFNKDSIMAKSGKRIFRIENPLYLPVVEEIEIKDNTTTLFPIKLIPNYGNVRLSADSASLIYTNGRFLGKGSWEGRLPSGRQTIECMAEGCAPSSIQITVVKNAPTATYKLPSPTPIYGSIEIGTTPKGVDVYINNEFIGTTGDQPLTKHNIQIGKKEITLRAANFASIKDTIIVVQDRTTNKTYTLNDKAYVTITTKPDSALVYLDNVYIGNTPYSGIINTGKHNITIVDHNNKYTTLSKEVIINSDNANITYTLKKQLLKRHEMYIEGLIGINNSVNFGGNIGFILSKYFNWELGITTRPTIEINNKTYSPTCTYFKIGSCIPVSQSIRIIPQIGIQANNFADNYIEGYGDKGYLSTSSTNSIVLGCRIPYAFTKNLGLSLTVEYRNLIGEESKYEFKDVAIDRVQNGINTKLGFFFFFGSNYKRR